MTAGFHETPGARASQITLGIVSGVAFALLAYLLMGRDVSPPGMIPLQDKVFHFLAFAGVTAPAALALPRRYLMFWLSHMVLLAVGTEIFQGLAHSQRQASVWDVAADLAGIVAATLISDRIRRWAVDRWRA